MAFKETLCFCDDACFFFFLKISFIYLFGRPRLQVGREAGREREEEAGSLRSWEPSVGLDPRMLGSWPEPKVEALTHWATQAPRVFCFYYYDFISLLKDYQVLKKGFMLTKITEKTRYARISMLYVYRELTCYVIDPALTVAALWASHLVVSLSCRSFCCCCCCLFFSN